MIKRLCVIARIRRIEELLSQDGVVVRHVL